MTPHEDPEIAPLREVLERHFASGAALDIVYSGGGLPGLRRSITPLRYCETRGAGYLIALCHRSGIEKTFRLDRMHLPAPPLAGGMNDFRLLSKCLGGVTMLEGMLTQIAKLGNLPFEQALAEHLERGGGFESFFDEYPSGGYLLQLSLSSSMICLTLSYEGDTFADVHYEFTPEPVPKLTPNIGTHYSLLTGRR